MLNRYNFVFILFCSSDSKTFYGKEEKFRRYSIPKINFGNNLDSVDSNEKKITFFELILQFCLYSRFCDLQNPKFKR